MRAPAKAGATALLRELAGELALLGVTSVYLFGSVARGDDTDESDLDIAVATVAPDDLMIDVHARELVEVHCGRPVDVAALPLPHPLRKYVGNDLVRVV